MTHRVRILRCGFVASVVDIDDYEIAYQWAVDRMQLERALDVGGVWAATIETGWLFVDPIGSARDAFISDHLVYEGLVLDKSLLHNPNVDLQHLFGMH